MDKKSVKEVEQACDEASREHVLWLLGRDPAAEQRELEEIVSRVKASRTGKN